ncbi:MAG: ParA family protein, partial [Bacteroidota bacterium]
CNHEHKNTHMKTFALYNLKGGVGKTTSCINLAYLAASEGHRVLVWDIDPQGGATYMFGHTPKYSNKAEKIVTSNQKVQKIVKTTPYPNIDLIPSDISARQFDVVLHNFKNANNRFKKLLQGAKREYNYVFIDCPPSLGLAAENVFRAADYILVPMIPSMLSEHAYERVRDFFQQNDYDIRKLVPFFTLVDERKRIHKDTILQFQTDRKKVLRSIVPYAAIIERMSEERAPLHAFSKKSRAANAYRNVWQELKWFRKLKPLWHRLGQRHISY